MDPFRNTSQPDWDWWGKLWPTPGATLRRLGLDRGTSLAEVGSGNGYFALPAARITAPAPVYAVDLEGSLLAELEELAARQEIENVRPIRGDARELDRLLPEPIDAVLLANAFHGIAPEDRATVLGAVHDSLRPGGTFVVVNWADRPREETTVDGETRGPPTELRVGPEETREAVREHTDLGFDRAVELPPYHYGLVFERER
ncbi:class I SAM-dependent methyltransferase [Natronococcus occultus]|uniref:Methylase involved in ubiquinone/menaquinone biosynthesis n=1 Tax=Natronococcus occultus SP4 TaxID=694430 RepID=L0JV53_9EURY|nr:class I SAM-dependent methyltransferase [Natronococcus occultus]AGB36887.1 methylase involved in ubiquinone/menaquinone biosynthesis [Natronococcus occultus SP4]